MNGLMRRLQKIQDECVEKQGQQNLVVDDKMDEFTRLKKKLAFKVKEIRQLIHDRDEMEKTAPSTVATVELSHKIRAALKEVRVDATQLDKLQKDEKAHYIKKNKEDKTKEEEIEKRAEIVETVFDHYKECQQLDQKRHGDTAFSRTNAPKDPLITSLPDIDDAGFQLLRKNDQIIDGMLDNVAAGVHELREIATEMGKEAEQQGIMLDDLDAKVDKVNDQLENINIRLRKALESVRKGDRFIVDIILLCVLLGLIGYIYSIVKK